MEIDYRLILDVPALPIRLVLPMVIVDELDRLKQSKDRHARWRAGHTLGALDSMIGVARQGVLKDPEYADGVLMSGATTVELLLGPPGHVRLPLADDEIVDRALAVKFASDRDVTVMTYDTGHATRARFAHLRVERLVQELEEEPSQQ